ncbi:MAG TPA: family 16 glycosylhydrolase [Thermoanaerobaculia bacterium]|jgi:beta-glucanase (GH16 family)|nr:family 16 glycosylhydrolase [Thermoanaerobaculia bacterium]
MLKARILILVTTVINLAHVQVLLAQSTFVPFINPWETGWIDHLRYQYVPFWYKRTGANLTDANFSTAFRSDKIAFANDRMIISLDRQGCCQGDPNCTDQCFGQPFVSGEYSSLKSNNGYGTYTVRMQTAEGCGLVTGFFLIYINFTMDSSGKAIVDEWHEIDFEVLGKSTNYVYTNYILKEGKDFPKYMDSQPILLEFVNTSGAKEVVDTSEALHTYSIKWTPTSIQWFFDGHQIRTVNASETPQKKLPFKAGKIVANLWAGCTSTSGYFAPCGAPGCTPICAFGDKASATFDFISSSSPTQMSQVLIPNIWTIW